MRQERWYDVPNYEGRYQISTRGRVRSLARVDEAGARRRTRILSPIVTSSGRRHYLLSKGGRAQTFCASVLMASAYHIPNPSMRGYVIHKNRDHTDFSRRNLAWATLAELRIHDGHKVSSRYLGVVCKPRRKGVLRWSATLNDRGRRYRLGYFATPEEAAYAYDCAIRQRGLDRPLNGVSKPAPFTPKIASLPGEIWRSFPGAATSHMISNKGRVRTRAYLTSNGQRVLPRLRKLSRAASGYQSVAIGGRRYGIAQVMAKVFPNPRTGAKRAS